MAQKSKCVGNIYVVLQLLLSLAISLAQLGGGSDSYIFRYKPSSTKKNIIVPFELPKLNFAVPHPLYLESAETRGLGRDRVTFIGLRQRQQR